MKCKFYNLCFFFVMFSSFLLHAQERTITGTVSDDSGPLPGVSVIIKGTTKGTETDFDGKYSIKLNTGDILVFSFVGMAVQEKTVGTTSVINVTLQADNVLDEVIVTGQGVGINRKRLTTTIDVLGAKEIENKPSTQLDELLQASAPSAQIRLSSGQPGTPSIIRTRGPITANASSTPVIIVDGVRVDNLNSNPSLGLATGGAGSSAIADIPLESIEKIEYVKGGAATTLYGADAANGVIQIITKKGTRGKATFNFETLIGAISGTTDFTRFKRTKDLIYRNGTSQTFRFGFNGGGDAFKYNFSGSTYYDDGFNRVNEQSRRNYRAGFTANVSDKLTYQGSVAFSSHEYTRDYNANTSFARYGNVEGGSYGDVDQLSEEDFNALKEQLDLEASLTDITDRVRRFQVSNKFTYKFNDSFTVNALIGMDSRNNRQEIITTNALLIAKGANPPGTTDQGGISRFTRNFLSITGEINAQHMANIGDDFSFITSIGGQFFRNNDFQQRAVVTGITDGAITINGGESVATDFQLGFANYGAYISENVSLWDKVFVDLGLRLDANTAFGDEIGLLYLPKFGLAYDASSESFWKNTFDTTISKFRVRVNWGQASNFPTPFANDLTILAGNFLGQQGFAFLNPGNSELTSETVTTLEYGVDLGLFNDRIKFGATIYDAETKDALFTPPQSPSSGQRPQLKNIGLITNKGYELSMQVQAIKSKKHSLDISASFNHNENLVVSTGGAPEFSVGGFTFLGSFIKAGLPLGYLRGSVTTIENGQPVTLRNQNLGTTFAPYFGSFSLNYSFNNKLSVFASADYQYGGQGVAVDDVLRFFGGINDADRFPQEINDFIANGGSLSFFNLASYWVEDTDYVKVRNIGATYRFGPIIKEIKDLTVSFNVTNPFNWASSSFDPEATGAGLGRQNSFAGGGFGFGTESQPRSFILSLKVRI